MEWLDALPRIILSIGIAGLFLLATFDSTVIFFMPFAIDWVFVLFVSHHRSWMPYYVLAAVCGSVLGCAITHMVVSKTSEQVLERHLPRQKFNRLKKKLDQNGFVAIMVAALLPPPFPFSPFVLAASIAKIPFRKLIGAVLTGRGIRFAAEGALTLILGRQILRLLNSRVSKIAMMSLFLLAVIGSTISVIRWSRKPVPAKKAASG